MNLTDQLGALESSFDELILAAASIPASPESSTASVADSFADAAVEPATTAAEPVVEEKLPVAEEKPTLNVSRPEKNVVAMTIGGVSVALSPEGLSELIEELSNARASMDVEQPPGGLPPGWRFVATKNPVMATQRYTNGDRLLVLRHTGHGWVPFSFSPDMVIEMYAMLTKR
ncbi:MAG: Putative tail fiber protein [Candidatus Burkholderia crenata]|nr:MAG: Putative tail fiber protein [Candidatus Burkholderia crenata]